MTITSFIKIVLINKYLRTIILFITLNYFKNKLITTLEIHYKANSFFVNTRLYGFSFKPYTIFTAIKPYLHKIIPHDKHCYKTSQYGNQYDSRFVTKRQILFRK